MRVTGGGCRRRWRVVRVRGVCEGESEGEKGGEGYESEGSV